MGVIPGVGGPMAEGYVHINSESQMNALIPRVILPVFTVNHCWLHCESMLSDITQLEWEYC